MAIAAGLAPDYNTFVRELIFAPLGAAQGSHYLRDFPRGMEPPLGARPSEYSRGAYETGLLTQGVPGVPQDALVPRRGPLGSSPDRQSAKG